MTATEVRAPSHAGDLGRRVAHRRHELGMSVDEVATAARVHPDYLRYLESAPSLPDMGTLLRIACALHTTADALLGADDS